MDTLAQDRSPSSLVRTALPRKKAAATDALNKVGLRAHKMARDLSLAQRIEVVASAGEEWDGMTPLAFWNNGKRDTQNGTNITITWSYFGELLEDRSHVQCGKGEGLWFAPVTTKNGRCRDEDIEAITQLSLDADNVGDWDVMRRVLEDAGLAHIIQRSSSHTPERPKWHVHIPLFVHWSGAKREWRRLYRHCVGWFSAAAELKFDLNDARPSFGFDKATDRLGQPWFPGTRRTPESGPPETICREGLAFDLEHFLATTGFDWVEEPSTASPHTSGRGGKATRAKAVVRGTPNGEANIGDSQLALAFLAAGMLGANVGDNKWAVVCPWEDEHTGGTTFDSSTVIFAPTRRHSPGWFHCSHSHCEGRGTREVLLALPRSALIDGLALQREAHLRSTASKNGGSQ